MQKNRAAAIPQSRVNSMECRGRIPRIQAMVALKNRISLFHRCCKQLFKRNTMIMNIRISSSIAFYISATNIDELNQCMWIGSSN